MWVSTFDSAFKKLLEKIAELGWGGQKQIAQRLGKNEEWVSRKLGQSRKLTLKDFTEICEALKINPGSLFEPCAKEYKSAEEFLRHLVREEVNKANPPEGEIKNGQEK